MEKIHPAEDCPVEQEAADLTYRRFPFAFGFAANADQFALAMLWQMLLQLE
jgi:hypothetical protein